MILILVAGHALANAPPVKRGIVAVVSLAKTPNQAVVLTFLVCTVAAFLNWGFGLVIAAMVSREMAKPSSPSPRRTRCRSGATSARRSSPCWCPRAAAIGPCRDHSWCRPPCSSAPMLQPFFALPVVAIAGIGIQRVMGYTVVTFLVTTVIWSGATLMLM